MKFDCQPSGVWIIHETDREPAVRQSGNCWTGRYARVSASVTDGNIVLSVSSPQQPIRRVAVRWDHPISAQSLVLGDAWERGYGSLQWRSIQPERVLPWYALAFDPSSQATTGMGVMTQPSAMCSWTIDEHGTTLWLDLSNGSGAVELGNRELTAATVVFDHARAGETSFDFARRFCQKMCPRPRLTSEVVYGSNNWYYAYGSFTPADILGDARLMAELSTGLKNRPYCVLDAGWSSDSPCAGGPWGSGNEKFPDMPGLAAQIQAMDVHPGIWIRPTAVHFAINHALVRQGFDPKEREQGLDITIPEVAHNAHEDIARLCQWGYKLIKHDFSTWDSFSLWGFQMEAEITTGDWHFHDRSRTNAEIILDYYRLLRDAAGDTILLGCNTIGHLAAGIFEMQRTGDDTSGKIWERTRRMGINTLAFRQPQNGTFFACDPDCVPHTSAIPWDKTRQWLDIVARSGSSLFVSVNPAILTPETRAAFHQAIQIAAAGGEPGGAEPLDWMSNTCPRLWRVGSRQVEYNWAEGFGADPLKC